MKNEIQIFTNEQFGRVRTLTKDSEPWFVGKDVAVALGYAKPENAISAHVDEVDKTTTLIQGDGSNYKSKTILINESGLYALIFGSKLDSAKVFKRWVTSEVLPAIRKTGAYAMPQDYPSALRALADSEERRLILQTENEQQKQIIADFEPVRQYVDAILSSDGTMATTQIAADYEISARMLNRILHEEGVQYNVNGQWILYRKYMGKGYTKSDTIHIRHADGRPDTRMHTKWTQKGRLMIHEILTRRGIRAVMDRNIA